jgi:hypothetical protein
MALAMTGAWFRIGQGHGRPRSHAALLLVLTALVLRILIPAGFMPAIGSGSAITLCTGMGAVSAWVDAQGKVHKDKPVRDGAADHPCAFAVMAAAVDLPAIGALPVLAGAMVSILMAPRLAGIVTGRGLAAPPPPPTGPPASL